MTGIEHLKTAVAFVATAFSSVTKATADGNIGLGDITTFIGLARKLPEGIAAIKEAPTELADLDPGEASELVQAVADAIGHDVITPKTQKIAEIALAMLPDFVQLYNAFRSEPEASE